ncbi:MAG TPA: (2Fe-2S)-binding protein [Gemmataceae bacterium]|nr:(2Fe-2S)-binding protein [Gemmataceae bacterium]
MQQNSPCDEPGSGEQLLTFQFDDNPVSAVSGQTIAAALMAHGQRTLRYTSRHTHPRGLFCGMGVCFDCLVQVDGRPNVRACQTPVANGMCVQIQKGDGAWEAAR